MPLPIFIQMNAKMYILKDFVNYFQLCSIKVMLPPPPPPTPIFLPYPNKYEIVNVKRIEDVPVKISYFERLTSAILSS